MKKRGRYLYNVAELLCLFQLYHDTVGISFGRVTTFAHENAFTRKRDPNKEPEFASYLQEIFADVRQTVIDTVNSFPKKCGKSDSVILNRHELLSPKILAYRLCETLPSCYEVQPVCGDFGDFEHWRFFFNDVPNVNVDSEESIFCSINGAYGMREGILQQAPPSAVYLKSDPYCICRFPDYRKEDVRSVFVKPITRFGSTVVAVVKHIPECDKTGWKELLREKINESFIYR